MSSIINEIKKNGEYPPLIFFFGEEEFLVEEAVNIILKDLIKDENDEFNFDTFDGDEDPQDKIAEIASSYPMMSKKRIVYIKRFNKLFSPRGSKKDEQTPLGRYIQSPSQSTVMIITGAQDSIKGLEKLRHNDKKLESKIKSIRFPYKVLFQNGAWKEFPKVYESNVGPWIKNRSKAKGFDIDTQAIELLMALNNTSLRELDNEIQKLILFIGKEQKNITVNDVNALSGSSKEYSVFELQKIVGMRDLKKSIDILTKMMKTSDQSILITTMLGRYFTILMILNDERKIDNNEYKLASKAGVSPFFVKEYLGALRRYSPNDLDNAIINITKADLDLKTSSGNKLVILQNMLISIMDYNR